MPDVFDVGHAWLTHEVCVGWGLPHRLAITRIVRRGADIVRRVCDGVADTHTAKHSLRGS